MSAHARKQGGRYLADSDTTCIVMGAGAQWSSVELKAKGHSGSGASQVDRFGDRFGRFGDHPALACMLKLQASSIASQYCLLTVRLMSQGGIVARKISQPLPSIFKKGW